MSCVFIKTKKINTIIFLIYQLGILIHRVCDLAKVTQLARSEAGTQSWQTMRCHSKQDWYFPQSRRLYPMTETRALFRKLAQWSSMSPLSFISLDNDSFQPPDIQFSLSLHPLEWCFASQKTTQPHRSLYSFCSHRDHEKSPLSQETCCFKTVPFPSTRYLAGQKSICPSVPFSEFF